MELKWWMNLILCVRDLPVGRQLKVTFPNTFEDTPNSPPTEGRPAPPLRGTPKK